MAWCPQLDCLLATNNVHKTKEANILISHFAAF